MKVISIFFLSFILFFACTKKKGLQDESITGLLKSLSETENFEQASACYTAGTLRIVSDIITFNNISKDELFPILAFLRGALSWDIIAEIITEDTAAFNIMITDHVTDNMVGFALPCLMRREQDKWRIDMEKEMTIMRDSFKSRSKNSYLNKKLKESL